MNEEQHSTSHEVDGSVAVAGQWFPVWLMDKFDAREQREIALAAIYAREFHHGTTGHNQLMLISKLVGLLVEEHKK